MHHHPPMPGKRLFRPIASRPIAAALALSFALPLLGGCATTTAQAPAASVAVASPVARQSAVIPFTAASASFIPGSGDYQLQWDAGYAGAVRVFASQSAEPQVKGKPVAQGDSLGTVTIKGLAPGRRWYFTLVPDKGAPLVIADRGLHLPTVPNLRDIGGYRTSDGRWVKMGLLYRSDQLDRLNDADLAAMGSLGLATVADLRTASERAREVDRLPEGVQHLVLDVAADDAGAIGGDMRAAQAAIASGKGAELLIAANRDFVSMSSARTAYAALLRRLETAPPSAVLYHCTAGKDRTGWATAVILTLLGVPRETVMADYLLSNRYLQSKNEAILASFAKSGSGIRPEYLESALTVRADYLQAAFDEVERRHGSFDAYLRDGIGLTDAEIAGLRRLYLTGEAAS